MAIERTLSIIKPDAVAKNVIGQIYARFVTGTAEPGLPSRIRFYAGALVKAGVALGAGAALWPFDKAGALRLAMRGWMNVGKLREMLRLEPAQMI